MLWNLPRPSRYSWTARLSLTQVHKLLSWFSGHVAANVCLYRLPSWRASQYFWQRYTDSCGEREREKERWGMGMVSEMRERERGRGIREREIERDIYGHRPICDPHFSQISHFPQFYSKEGPKKGTVNILSLFFGGGGGQIGLISGEIRHFLEKKKPL